MFFYTLKCEEPLNLDVADCRICIVLRLRLD